MFILYIYIYIYHWLLQYNVHYLQIKGVVNGYCATAEYYW